MRHWIFQGTPNVFDLTSYLAERDQINWEVRQRHLAPRMAIGDDVYFWRAKGSSNEESGVVAVGRITSLPSFRPEDADAVKYWRQGDPTKPSLRVGLDVTGRCLSKKQIVKREWLKEDPILRDLRILKFANETNYEISGPEANRLAALARNTGRDWNRDESMAALWAFNQTEEGEVSKLASSPVASVAVTIGRAVGGVYNKVMNFRAIDPRDERSGLSAGNEVDRQVWAEFYDPKTQSLRTSDLQSEYIRLWGSTPSQLDSIKPHHEVVCRLCWNSEGWTHPTGEAQKLEKDTFVSKNGFGHEEWLMNVGWLVDGYHYGFLQPFHSAFKKWHGKTTDVLLYTISPAKVRYYVGRIKGLQVLTAEHAVTAVRRYRKLGWYKEMLEQVKAVGGRTRTIDNPAAAYDLLNVRFDPRKLEVSEPVVPADSYLERLPGRYRVYQPKGQLVASPAGNRRKRRRAQDISNKSLLPQVRKGSGTVIANPIEKIMQREICDSLKRLYSSVETERDFVDIKVQRPEGITLIELKSSASALQAIRSGLGQVLEYAFVHPEWRSALFELIIVGQGLPTDQSTEYINWLREKYKLPVRYISYKRGSTIFQL